MKKLLNLSTPHLITLLFIIILPFFAAAQTISPPDSSSPASADTAKIIKADPPGSSFQADPENPGKTISPGAGRKIGKQPPGENQELQPPDGESEKKKSFKKFLKDIKSKRYVLRSPFPGKPYRTDIGWSSFF